MNQVKGSRPAKNFRELSQPSQSTLRGGLGRDSEGQISQNSIITNIHEEYKRIGKLINRLD